MDIKPIVSIFAFSDYYFFILAALLIAVLLVVLGIFVLRFLKRKNPRKTLILALRSLDLKNVKKASYEISKLAKLLKNDTIEQEFLALEKAMQKYKYKKHTPQEFEPQDLEKLRDFLDKCND